MSRVPPFMGDFSDEDVAWAVEVGVQRQVPAGEAIIVEGQPVGDLYVILEGSFAVQSRQLRMLGVSPLGPGEMAGEMSYVRRQLPLATVRAITDSVVLCIPRRALDEKIAADEGFAARFHKVVSEFTVDRLYAYGPPDAPRPDEGSPRVYELIEKMLRGEFP